MIDVYFLQLEEIIRRFPSIQSYSITKKIYNDKQGYLRGSISFENGYRLDFVEVKHTDHLTKIKYKYQYMDENHKLIFRYDNAPHYPHLNTHPHHRHSSQSISESKEQTLETVLFEILSIIGNESGC